MSRVEGLGRRDDWSGVRAVVAGFGVSGFAAADNLIHIGAQVRAVWSLTATKALPRGASRAADSSHGNGGVCSVVTIGTRTAGAMASGR